MKRIEYLPWKESELLQVSSAWKFSFKRRFLDLIHGEELRKHGGVTETHETEIFKYGEFVFWLGVIEAPSLGIFLLMKRNKVILTRRKE